LSKNVDSTTQKYSTNFEIRNSLFDIRYSKNVSVERKSNETLYRQIEHPSLKGLNIIALGIAQGK